MLLFRSLSGRSLPRVTDGPLLGAAALLFAGCAAGEEVVWRWFVFGGLSPRIGWPAALLVSTLGFAATHVRARTLRPVRVHILTGATFGSIYVLTGRLVAAIVCHAAYNVLIALKLAELDEAS
ncbi:MAG: CPBP family intramembrane glutamic endopeptidase [Gaiellaceae bacterium]